MNDFELARLVERCEASVWEDAVRGASPATAERLGLRAVPAADGLALMALNVPRRTFNRAFAFGFDAPLDEAALDHVVALYPREIPFTIQPCPLARPAAMSDWLEARGLPSHFDWVRWVREAGPVADAATDLTIERIGPARARDAAGLVARVFEYPETEDWLAELVGRPRWSHYLALDGGRPVATAALFVDGEAAWLGYAVTLGTHRGRGAQQALVARRMQDAAALGARWITVETADDLPERPNPSFRNVRRAGFRLLFRRPSHAHFVPELEARVAHAPPA